MLGICLSGDKKRGTKKQIIFINGRGVLCGRDLQREMRMVER
jgi:hypothetical protein